MKELLEIMRRELDGCGVISFARFMELALYCPEFGFYDRLTNTVGKRGHFYTSVAVGSLFGELLASQFAHWLADVQPAGGQVLEAGAHEGQLASDILGWLSSKRGDLFEKLEYWILEPSPRRRQSQTRKLEPFAGKVRWFKSWRDLPEARIHGVIFANELLDAMPVHRLRWNARKKSWFEWGVAAQGDQFVWRMLRQPVLAPSHYPRLSAELEAVLPDGFTTEVCPAAVEWWTQASLALGDGRLLAFDYGLAADEFLLPERAGGTLRAYYRHRPSDDLLGRVGEQDLTAHVNFTAIQRAGESAGLKSEGLLTQARFLTSVVEAVWQAQATSGPWTSQLVRQFQTLTHPEHLGTKFKVLIQRSNRPTWEPGGNDLA